MSKLVKPLVFAMLVLSIVSLTLGIMLFGRREVLKRRVQTLETGAEGIAQAIRYPGLNRMALMDPDTMDGQVRALQLAARNQFETLEETKETLETTRGTLAQTRSTLESTEATLDQTRETVARLEGDIRTRDSQLAQRNSEIMQLEDEKLSLEQDIEVARDQIQQQMNQLADARAEYESLQQAYEDEVRRSLALSATDTGDVIMSSDVTGRILSVNPEWNFVVLDIGSDEGMRANAVMLVHRGPELVGKIRISDVRSDISVGEILLDSMLLSIHRGDSVITPQG